MRPELRIALAVIVLAMVALFLAGVFIDVLAYENAKLLLALGARETPGDRATIIDGESRVVSEGLSG